MGVFSSFNISTRVYRSADTAAIANHLKTKAPILVAAALRVAPFRYD
jgi:hypothetical protein